MYFSTAIYAFFFIYILGLTGIFFNRSNIVSIIMSIELVLLSINLIFLTSSSYLDDLFGNLIALIILTVAAAESSIGLALVVRYYRTKGTISTEFLNLLRG